MPRLTGLHRLRGRQDEMPSCDILILRTTTAFAPPPSFRRSCYIPRRCWRRCLVARCRGGASRCNCAWWTEGKSLAVLQPVSGSKVDNIILCHGETWSVTTGIKISGENVSQVGRRSRVYLFSCIRGMRSYNAVGPLFDPSFDCKLHKLFAWQHGMMSRHPGHANMRWMCVIGGAPVAGTTQARHCDDAPLCYIALYLCRAY